jgi:hypothetical protein
MPRGDIGNHKAKMSQACILVERMLEERPHTQKETLLRQWEIIPILREQKHLQKERLPLPLVIGHTQADNMQRQWA